MSPVFVFVKHSSPYAFLVHWGVFNYISLHIFFTLVYTHFDINSCFSHWFIPFLVYI